MFKNAIKYECSLNNRNFSFVFESDSPTTDLKEILFHIIKFIGQYEDRVKEEQALLQSAAQQEQKSAEAAEEMENDE